MAAFTPEEKALLTPFNAVAYDLLRRDSAPVVQPCWLCMSDEVRKEAREKLRCMLETTKMGRPVSMEDAEAFVALAVPEDLLEIWHQAELERKAGRERQDPHAWFME